jgi:hypothetical protein
MEEFSYDASSIDETIARSKKLMEISAELARNGA